jgi:predicted RNase H-like HicB family nuclease
MGRQRAATLSPAFCYDFQYRSSLSTSPALLKFARGKHMNRRVLLYPGEDGYTVAEVPSLPGCVSQGTTREEALANIREAISLHEEVLRERGEVIPEDNVELVEVAA